MRAVITVVGKDRTGIIAKISDTLYQHQVNIDKCTVEFSALADLLDKDGEELGMKIHTMHEDIFDAMHKI